MTIFLRRKMRAKQWPSKMSTLIEKVRLFYWVMSNFLKIFLPLTSRPFFSNKLRHELKRSTKFLRLGVAGEALLSKLSTELDANILASVYLKSNQNLRKRKWKMLAFGYYLMNNIYHKSKYIKSTYITKN